MKFTTSENLPTKRVIKLFIGIDPGKKGATGIIDRLGNLFLIDHKKVSLDEYCMIMRGYSLDSFALIEKVHAAPKEKQGVVSAFTFGKQAGYVEAAVTAAGISEDRRMYIAPSKWQGALRTLTKGKKQVTYIKAIDSFPGQHEQINMDNADAALIALYCKSLFE